MLASLKRLFCAFMLGLAWIGPIGSVAALDLITGNDYVPYTDQRLPGGGFASEMIREIVRDMGHTVTLRFLPWKRGYELTEAGEAIATFPYAKSRDRAQAMLYSDAMFSVTTRVFFNKDHRFRYHNVDSLDGKLFCNPRGYILYDEIRERVERGTLKMEEPSDMASCARMVAAGRADFLISDTFTLQDVAVKFGVWEKLEASNKIFAEKANHLIVGRNTKGGAEFIEKFNQSLRDFKKSPRFYKLIAQYGLAETIH